MYLGNINSEPGRDRRMNLFPRNDIVRVRFVVCEATIKFGSLCICNRSRRGDAVPKFLNESQSFRNT